MTVLNILFTLCMALLITGAVVRCYPYYIPSYGFNGTYEVCVYDLVITV